MTKQFTLLPDYTCPELAGYKLPSFPRSQEDVVMIEYPERPLGVQGIIDYQAGFQSGYTKAREKFEFSREDLINLVEGLKIYTSETQSVLGYDTWEASYFVDMFIDNRTPRTPIAIEVEMWPAIPGKSDNEIPKTNPDGTVKVVRWIFND